MTPNDHVSVLVIIVGLICFVSMLINKKTIFPATLVAIAAFMVQLFNMAGVF